MTPGAGPRDRSLELAADRLQAAREAFVAAPNRWTGDSLRERAWVFWIRRNGCSAGFDRELARLDRVIARAIEDAGEED